MGSLDQPTLLVRDALSGRYMEGTGCFVSNKSCRLLREAGESVLAPIEKVLLEEVQPFYHCSTDSLDRQFPGLLSLLVTYFAVGKDNGSDRFVPFFRRIYGSLKVEAMRAVSIVWLKRAPTARLPEPLRVSIEELAVSGTGPVQEVARWVLENDEELRNAETSPNG
jgi:hypothetical protein